MHISLSDRFEKPSFTDQFLDVQHLIKNLEKRDNIKLKILSLKLQGLKSASEKHFFSLANIKEVKQ